MLTGPPDEYQMDYAQKIADHLVIFLNLLPENVAVQHYRQLMIDYRARYSAYSVEAIIAESNIVGPHILEEASRNPQADMDNVDNVSGE